MLKNSHNLLIALVATATLSIAAKPVDWPVFMADQDMTWTSLPPNWMHAPHFGNADVGSMLYRTGNTICLQVFRADVQDHRDDTYGWNAYSRPRLQIGRFFLNPVGKLQGCEWRKDLWNAELTGTITTTKGTIRIRHFVHADDPAIVTEITPSEGESGCSWSWQAWPARTTRGGYPARAQQVEGFARTYGDKYRGSLKLFTPNPEGERIEHDDVICWRQNLLAGGQYATAWTEAKRPDGVRAHIVSIANSYPEATAEAKAVADVQTYAKRKVDDWLVSHRKWWQDYFQLSHVSLPDKKMEALYWQTIWRLGCTARAGRSYIDTPGIWTQGGGWCYTTTDHNIQVAHWPLYTANRLDISQGLVDHLHDKRDALIRSVRPEEWQADSAFLNITVSRDFYGARDQDKRYWNCVGCLPWVMHNCWLQYRFSMDDEMLRVKIYPLLRRSINMYLHMLVEGDDGKLHLQPTYSPETGVFHDTTFDLALLKWGCYTLLKAADRLKINDPLIARWREVTKRTIDFPVDKKGFMIGTNKSAINHRHASHLLMTYPLFLVNVDQPGTKELTELSLRHFRPGGKYPGMKAAYSGPIYAAFGNGDGALADLTRLKNDLLPNGMWLASPCLEVSLSAANIINEMLLQSWSDPANDDSGPIRVFPACPEKWQDVSFRNLRTEGAFLVSAERKAGKTAWIRIESLAGEPCRIRPNMAGTIKTTRDVGLKPLGNGVYHLNLAKGDSVGLYVGDSVPEALQH